MPVYADAERNFITGLSDFWSVFFKDTTQMRSVFDAVQISVGQVYLEMLQSVLGTSLKSMPLFSKFYYKLFTVRERDLSFVEGPSISANRYVFTPPGDAIVEVPSLMNKVIAPTRVLQPVVDYDVADGQLKYARNPFNIDGNGTSEPLFPVSVVQEVYPAEYVDPLSTLWSTSGVETGDTFRFRIGAGSFNDIRIAGFDSNTLLLDANQPELHATLAPRTWSVVVLRVPSDAAKVGVLVPHHPISATTVSVTPVAGGVTVTAASAASSWVGKYLFLYDAGGDPTNNGFYRVQSVSVGVSATLARTFNFGAPSGPTEAHLVDFGANLGPSPITTLPNTFIDTSVLSLSARRLYARVVEGVVYPAGEEILPGIDYQVDGVTGQVAVLSVWDPLHPARATYTWQLAVASAQYQFRRDVNNGAWTTGTSYAVGDVVTALGGAYYVNATAHVSGGSIDLTKFRPFQEPFAFGGVHAMRQMPFWAPDVLVDQEALYNNFGYLLSFRKPTSEQYRAFLRGVAQLFLLGPTLERFESALNVMAGYPVIRDDDEVLQAYADGIFAQGTNGQFIDSAEARDGTLDPSGGGTFQSATANFYASDLGAVIRVRNGVMYDSYVITAVNSANSVVVSPAPLTLSTNVQWTYTHNVLNRRFRVTDGSYAFVPEDENALLLVRTAQHGRNIGAFRIVTVENVTTVILESAYGFEDESGLDWQLSRTQKQVVTTSRASYELPLLAPIRDEVSDTASLGTLRFQSFDTLTSAFLVEDYVRNPTWWHNITIPKELLQLSQNAAGRRRVSPDLIEHIYNALDEAVYGDFGLSYGRDDEGGPGLIREGEASWYGGTSVLFEAGVEQGTDGNFTTPSTFTSNTANFAINDVGASFHMQVGLTNYNVVINAVLNRNSVTLTGTVPGFAASNVQWRYAHKAAPKARARDVGQHLVIYGEKPPGAPLHEKPPTIGFFKVRSVADDGLTLDLERFPPPELQDVPTPLRLRAALPPLLFRRTVAFVIMDRFLKYHAVRIRIDRATPLNAEFISEVTTLVKEARASHTFVYLEPITDFVDKVSILDSFSIAFGPALLDRFFGIENRLAFSASGRVRYNDFFRFVSGSCPVDTTVYTPQTLTAPSPPGSGTFRTYFLVGRFALSAVMGNNKRPVRDTDYSFDFDTGVFQVLSTDLHGAFGATAPFNVVVVYMRQRVSGDPLDAYETGLVYNGTDPTMRIDPSQNPHTEGGFIDRALQINIT